MHGKTIPERLYGDCRLYCSYNSSFPELISILVTGGMLSVTVWIINSISSSASVLLLVPGLGLFCLLVFSIPEKLEDQHIPSCILMLFLPVNFKRWRIKQMLVTCAYIFITSSANTYPKQAHSYFFIFPDCV